MSTTTENTETAGVHRSTVLAQVAALRALCDFAEEHVDVFPDYILACDFAIWITDAEEMAQRAFELGGTWRKSAAGDYFYLTRDFGGSEYSRVTLSLNTKRENVCERQQVGVETRRVPDPQLVAEIPLVEIEEPVYAWACPDSLLRMEDFT